MWALSLLAADDPLKRPEILYGIAGLMAALLAGAVVISLADRWRRRVAEVARHDDTDMLTTYRDMFEHGEITEAEYAELRRKVADKVKGAPAPAAGGAATAIPPSSAAPPGSNDPTLLPGVPPAQQPRPPAAPPEPPQPPGGA